MLATTTTPKPKLDFTDPAPGFEHPETHNSSSALMTLGYHPPDTYRARQPPWWAPPPKHQADRWHKLRGQRTQRSRQHW